MPGRASSGDPRFLKSRIRLDLRREKTYLDTRTKPNLQSLKEREQEFRITLQNKFALLTEEEESVGPLNENLTKIMRHSISRGKAITSKAKNYVVKRRICLRNAGM